MTCTTLLVLVGLGYCFLLVTFHPWVLTRLLGWRFSLWITNFGRIKQCKSPWSHGVICRFCHLELESHHDPWNGWILTISLVAEMATQLPFRCWLGPIFQAIPHLFQACWNRQSLEGWGKPKKTHWWNPSHCTLFVIHNSLEIRLVHHGHGFRGFHCFRGDCPLGTSLLEGLHVCGDSTYPGIGVPSAAMSGHICAVGIHRWGWGLDGVKFSHGSSFP